MMKKILKKIASKRAISAYHYMLAVLSAIVFGFPSKKMIVIGVTGTKGKTSAANFIWACLTQAGYKTGIISTANIRIGEQEVVNKYHMTMPGRFVIQRLIGEMKKQGCKYCIVETTSEGIKQYRHIGVCYDIAVFTNLHPEHLQAHGGSFDEYKRMKGKMFLGLGSCKKTLEGKKIEKVIIANKDSQYADYFLSFKADKKITFSTLGGRADLQAKNIQENENGVSFAIENKIFQLAIPGRFNVANALPAIAISRLTGINDEQIAKGLLNLKIIPGRMEQIEMGQSFKVFVDYAHEKEGLTNVLQTAKNMAGQNARVIVLLGAEGGGRDKAKRPQMGEVVGKMADYVIVSNVDPYEDDPKQILEDIAIAAQNHGKIRGKDLFVIEDRRGGIKKALSLAQKNDIVLITGKGAEQSIVIGGKRSPWDDRVVVKEELQKIVGGVG